MTDHNRPTFRADINGLRAWAVVAVIFYHFGIPGFGGGFVGVDVFFVISGFLMTGLVVKGLERGTFSVLGFYMARGRRIVPALVVLCVVLLIMGWFVLLPPDYKMLSTHSVYALTFLSNIEFWQEAGYFDVASHEKWLLHTWSLSVEWQFYLILPVVLWAVWRIKAGRVTQTWTVGLGLVASLAASIWVTSKQPSAAFYLLHTRAWEMLGGGLVFLLANRVTLTTPQRRWLELAGLFAIVLAIGVFDKDAAWPGWWAVLPVAAAMTVLLANHHSFWTASRIPQWLGDRSYSLYLWHWPVVVAITYFSFEHEPWVIVAALLLTALLGHLSYVWVENTSRRLLEQTRLPYAGGGLLLAVTIAAAPAVAIWKLQGIGGRFSSNIEFVANESKNYNPRRGHCLPNKGVSMPLCMYGGEQSKIVVVGDSHADALISGVAAADASAQAGVTEWTYSGCNFLPGSKIVRAKEGSDYNCNEFNILAAKSLENLPKNIPIIIINRYAATAMGENEANLPFQKPGIFFSRIFDRTTPEFLSEFAQHITESSCQLAKNRTVYMVRPIPEIGFDVPRALSMRMIFGIKDDLWIPKEAYLKRNDWVWVAQNAARDKCGVRILDPIPYLCREDRCYGSLNGRPLYFDDDHLSEFGNKLLLPMFAEVFKSL